jgi:redox-sensitive bicupin YhaK (pirin superfamily)
LKAYLTHSIRPDRTDGLHHTLHWLESAHTFSFNDYIDPRHMGFRQPGDVQRMSAGTGISHSEYNHSPTTPVHFLQIWILPERQGLEPSYEQRLFAPEELRGQWRLIAARDGRDGAVVVHQDVDVLAARLEAGGQVTYRLQPGRHAWVQVASGGVRLNGVPLNGGDGAALSQIAEFNIMAGDRSEILLFDLA